MVDFVRRTQAAAREATAVVGSPTRPLGILGWLFGSLNIWFWAIVGLPTLIAGVYFFAIASDLYASEVMFVVRGPAKQAPSIMSAVLSGVGGGDAGSQDSSTVEAYVMSRDVVRKLAEHDNLQAVLTRPEGDFLSRFPGFMFWRKDFEALYDSYRRFVSVEPDPKTGVTTLDVKAYRPEDAQNIARALMQDSEELINELNARAREDSVTSFELEVADAQRNIAQIQTQLTAYRVQQQILDPKSAATGPVELLAQENSQLAEAQGQLSALLASAPESPQIPSLRVRIAAVEKLIEEQRAKITGSNNSVATALTEYERLDGELQLAEKALAASYASLQSARLEAERQQLYLETISQPNLPDYPLYPHRFGSFLTVVATCLLAYGIAWVLVAGVREHASA